MHWPADGRQAMTELAGMFPSFARRDVPGIAPWEPLELVRWLNTSGAPTSGSRHAALFLLSIWNREDWSDRRAFERGQALRIRRSKESVRRIGRFDISDAWAVWDEGHRRAALAWLVEPFWP